MFEIEHGVLKKYIPEDKEEHITIPQEVFHINGGAFSNCPYLVSVTFTAKVHSIYDNTFINCPRLSSVIFSNDFQDIGSCSTKDSSGPFVDCPKLKHLDLPATVKRVRLGSSDIESVRIYEGLVKLPNNIFSGCEKLRKVYLPASVEAIEEAAFIDCVELEYVKLPSGLKTIGLMAFWGCKKLRSIELPETVTKIGNDCFNVCGLEEVKLPEGIEIIE
ncbi:MAG: leucine-rich repeat protein, partial [Clostridia bacterium]|nr:leucine-rich repeat protein [Clostridia bacterium]